ncbi:MAG: hypothetical protein IPP59_11075 [Betaproteobacteria bacterium]|nr:hypothetical protein [Candidatus Dechloromonas phosphorivorans]
MPSTQGDTQTEKSEPGDYAETLASLVALSESLQHWHAMASHFGELPVVETISMRITMLERNLAGVGINLVGPAKVRKRYEQMVCTGNLPHGIPEKLK